MQSSIPRGNKKKSTQPVIVTTENKFTPKVSERTIEKRRKAKEDKYKRSRFATGLDLFGIICLYTFLVLCILIGAGGITVCIIYYNTDSNTTGWKIAGIVLGAIVCIIGFILIILTIFKQARNRPWRYKKKEERLVNNLNDDLDDDDDDDDQIQSDEFIRANSPEDSKNLTKSQSIQSPTGGKTRETASSPMPDTSNGSSHLNSVNNDLIFCPGCNRLHPSAHQCMYSTRIANGLSTQIRSNAVAPKVDSIAIQTEDDGKKKKKTPHTVIDRQLKYSYTSETQTDVTANPRSNITESVILRRVPIPTSKVVVQQPTTKVMIVKVPNVAGQLVIQPKNESNDKQTKS